jgi:NADH-quinone oxidoreductase subunit J
MSWAQVFFYVFAVLSVILALMVVTRRKAIHSAIFLILTFICFAATYVIMNAELLAAIQVLVYAGGVVGLIIFVIMLVKAEEDEVKQSHGQGIIALFIGLLLAVEVAFIVLGSLCASSTGALAQKMASAGGNTEALGVVLYTKYLFPFEVASVLLLAAMIGAITLAKYKLER